MSIFPALEPGSLNVKKRLLGGEDGYQVAIILSSHTAHYLPLPPLPLLCACLKEYFETSGKIGNDVFNQKDPDLHYGSKRDGRDTLEH